MKEKIKRLRSYLIVFVLIFMLVPTVAFASESEQPEEDIEFILPDIPEDGSAEEDVEESAVANEMKTENSVFNQMDRAEKLTINELFGEGDFAYLADAINLKLGNTIGNFMESGRFSNYT